MPFKVYYRIKLASLNENVHYYTTTNNGFYCHLGVGGVIALGETEEYRFSWEHIEPKVLPWRRLADTGCVGIMRCNFFSFCFFFLQYNYNDKIDQKIPKAHFFLIFI